MNAFSYFTKNLHSLLLRSHVNLSIRTLRLKNAPKSKDISHEAETKKTVSMISATYGELRLNIVREQGIVR